MKLLLILLFVTHTIDSTYRIGYSTKYGYGFNQQKTVTTATTYNPKYYNTCGTYGPKRSPQRPYSGNWLEDLADWWRINTDEDWPSYVDEDYWDEFLAEYPEYTSEVEQWFEEHGKIPPWLLPIGDLGPLFLFGFLYVKRRRKKN